MSRNFKISYIILLGCCLSLVLVLCQVSVADAQQSSRDSVPPIIGKIDTIPLLPLHRPKDSILTKKGGWFRRFNTYVDSMMSSKFRDSVLKRISKADKPSPKEDSSFYKSELTFKEHRGKVIRKIIYRQLKVFGPGSINDTTFTTNNKLIKFANGLHYNSKIWLIRQNLFFRETDTVNAYEMAENERYLRSRPFIQDARIYVVNSNETNDTADILVITKDVFEYGGDLSRVKPDAFGARVFNNNLFGAGQAVTLGFLWENDYSPKWNTEVRYTKYNIGGAFIDANIGYSTLNNTVALDSGVYEGSYYINFNRPLFRTTARWAGGLMMSQNFSINIRDRPDSLYRDYRYNYFDLWAGYNISRRRSDDGIMQSKPNMAILFRYNNIHFDRRPEQEQFHADPIYNNRHYYLGQFYIFKQDFFKAHHFFGFGRTEDIPFGFNTSITTGWEQWVGRERFYTGIEVHKDWLTHLEGIISLQAGVGTFWQGGTSEDAVIHTQLNYYSKLMRLGQKGYFRQFGYFDYLCNPNNYFYRPLNINRNNGLMGYRKTMLNGYQRLNLGSESVYYSPLKFYGFKFSFFASLQGSLLSYQSNNIFKNPFYTGLGGGFRVRNENLSFNTVQVGAYVYPDAPPGMKGVWFQVTTLSDIRFDIFALKIPSFISFK
ncbi:hypothetical protein COR50_00985 [Chitinophaga caeni]|uniref:Bacterial surface antigen (D15) domain-containing protein n=1 Tax=Chitinophaga caeni TaxID=2029983 RepID=A0A291QPI4_9BACT|nr:hypothetical protein COR50_00985 [Chitinophaga caeni]